MSEYPWIHLGHFALAALHGLGQLLELGADLAQGDRRLQVSISPLQLIEFRWQIHAHHANLLLQTVACHARCVWVFGLFHLVVRLQIAVKENIKQKGTLVAGRSGMPLSSFLMALNALYSRYYTHRLSYLAYT